jgi:hypothetical protein
MVQAALLSLKRVSLKLLVVVHRYLRVANYGLLKDEG